MKTADKQLAVGWGLSLLIMVMLVYQIYVIQSDIKDQAKAIHQLKVRDDFWQDSDVIGDIEQIGEQFADAHNYTKSYNCVNYSEDFRAVLSDLGYKANTVSGCAFDNESSCHRWVRITLDYEPITGQFVDYGQEYEEYEER